MGESNGHLSEDKIAEFKAKYGKHWAAVEIDDDFEVAIRAPKKMEWQRFTEEALEGGKKALLAAQTLAATCLIYPENAQTTMEEYPALFQTLIKPLGGLAGNREEARVKKY